ncbi:MAG: DUF547 domain-containing protein, partial [Verrucomicrobia bacterium]|nr:DUF547 domain-containing protein [Verrucomicrobiota bacterium]
MRLTTILGICAVGVTLHGVKVFAGDADLHHAWQEVLQVHVDEQGGVTYKALKENPAILNDYLAILASTKPGALSEKGQLTYWINAYNAFTIKLILDNYPIKSIRRIKKPWDQKVWEAGGQLYSLNEIEHGILRKKFNDPRVHFAIVCASIGCPNLWNQAYREASIDDQLDAAARRFIGAPKHFEVSTEKDLLGGQKVVLKMSSIFKWFKGDFTNHGEKTLPDFVLPYVDRSSQIVIESSGEDIK